MFGRNLVNVGSVYSIYLWCDKRLGVIQAADTGLMAGQWCMICLKQTKNSAMNAVNRLYIIWIMLISFPILDMPYNLKGI